VDAARLALRATAASAHERGKGHPSKQTCLFGAAAVLGLASGAGIGISSLNAQQKTIKLGITLPLTGADTEDATLMAP
jgi:hypothetical protein